MSTTHPVDLVTVWFDNGAPARLLWRGERWRVTDTPTPLDDFAWSRITHPPRMIGWRFQGTRLDGSSRVFDIRQAGTPQQWELIRSYV